MVPNTVPNQQGWLGYNMHVRLDVTGSHGTTDTVSLDASFFFTKYGSHHRTTDMDSLDGSFLFTNPIVTGSRRTTNMDSLDGSFLFTNPSFQSITDRI
jgi:hypothetical protein